MKSKRVGEHPIPFVGRVFYAIVFFILLFILFGVDTTAVDYALR